MSDSYTYLCLQHHVISWKWCLNGNLAANMQCRSIFLLFSYVLCTFPTFPEFPNFSFKTLHSLAMLRIQKYLHILFILHFLYNSCNFPQYVITTSSFPLFSFLFFPASNSSFIKESNKLKENFSSEYTWIL